ncbi:hypothetical protein [Bacillus infantis]|uniref:hypothetical protein n=1 Tax=Bacillus infantis TaxID=324767 RepID=UPI003CF21BA4
MKRRSRIAVLIIIMLMLCSCTEKGKVELKEEANAVFDISGKKADYSFLQKVIKDKRIVFLGENSHTVQEFNETKGEIIQYLHKEMGFNLLVFESGYAETLVHHANTAHLSSIELMKKSIFGTWHTAPTLDLFQYIKDSQSQKEKLILSGIDIYPNYFYLNEEEESPDEYGVFLYNWFLPISREAAEQAKEAEKTYKLVTNNLKSMRTGNDGLIRSYRNILNFIKEHSAE